MPSAKEAKKAAKVEKKAAKEVRKEEKKAAITSFVEGLQNRVNKEQDFARKAAAAMAKDARDTGGIVHGLS